MGIGHCERRLADAVIGVLWRAVAGVAIFGALATLPAAAPPDGAISVARNLYVDSTIGDDLATGLAPQANGTDGPLRTLRPAIRQARPGDTIHLTPQAQACRDIAVFHDVHGEPGRPITLDGHGATISGSEPLDPGQWDEVAPGLYRCDHLLPEKLLTQDDAIIERWFMLFDGQMNHMGRSRKGKSLPLKKIADLQTGEWSYEVAGHAFYVKIDPAKRLVDYRIETPLRPDGVQISGDCSHLIIRNLTATHVYNDGYGLHGKTRDVRFENIGAIECGDDGFSAHDDCDVAVDGFVSLRNATGLANTGASHSINSRLFLDGNRGTDLLFFGSSQHTITESVVRCSGDYSLRMWADGFETRCTVELNNVLLERAGDTSPLKIWHNGALRATRTTMLGLSIEADCRSVDFDHCLIGGRPAPEILLSPASIWKADHNVYDLVRLRIGNDTYNAASFADYRRASGQDTESRWMHFDVGSQEAGPFISPEPGIGADAARLPHQR